MYTIMYIIYDINIFIYYYYYHYTERAVVVFRSYIFIVINIIIYIEICANINLIECI